MQTAFLPIKDERGANGLRRPPDKGLCCRRRVSRTLLTESEVLRGARSRMIKRFGASHSLSSLRRGGKRSRARPPALAARHRAGHAAAGQKMKLHIDTHTHAEFRYLSFARARQPTTAAGRKFAPRVFNFQPRSAQLHMRARNAGLRFGHQLLVACCPCLQFYQPRSSIKNGRDHRFKPTI